MKKKNAGLVMMAMATIIVLFLICMPTIWSKEKPLHPAIAAILLLWIGLASGLSIGLLFKLSTKSTITSEVGCLTAVICAWLFLPSLPLIWNASIIIGLIICLTLNIVILFAKGAEFFFSC